MSRRLKLAALAPFVVLSLYLYWTAATLRLDTFDTYEIFLNSRLLSGESVGNYFVSRSFVFPLLLSPVFWLARHLASDPPSSALVACHFISVTITCLFAWSCYLLLRTHLGRLQSWLGAALLFLNPLVIHTSPISKEDQPGALFTTLAMLFYLRLWNTGKSKQLALAGLFTLLTVGTRYNLLPLMPLVFVAHELLATNERRVSRDFLKKAAVLGLIPSLAWIIVPTIIYAGLGIAPLMSATARFLNDLYLATTGAMVSEMPYAEPPTEAFEFLLWALSPVICVFAVWGLVAAWLTKTPGRLFHSIWFGVFLGFHALILGHKEARYFLPLFVPLYYFATVGISSAMTVMVQPWKKVLLLALLAAFPLWRGLDECRKFLDPFYRRNFAKEVSDRAVTVAAGNPIAWLGPFYALHPREYVFHLHDPVTYLYHVFTHTVRYYTGLSVASSNRKIEVYIPGRDPNNGVMPQPELAIHLKNGHGVILNAEPAPYVTMNVPLELKPLVVERALVHDFFPGPRGAYACATNPSLFLRARLEPKSLVTTLTQKEKRAWLVYASYADKSLVFLGILDPFEHGPELRAERLRTDPAGSPVAYRLISFDSVKLIRSP